MNKANRLDRLEQFMVALITSRADKNARSLPIRILLKVLKHLSYIYYAVIQTRLWLYEHRIFRYHALGCQVISIGNLVVGGTGKTPVVEIFARNLQKKGRKVAILSRGYKKEEPPILERIIRKLTLREMFEPPRIVSDGKKLLLDSSMSGDEPYMLASNLSDVCVLVDKDRVKSGRYAIDKFGCDTLILDDGFQYLSLKHMVEIVLVDKTNPFGNEHMLPRGLLREPIKNIKRANFIFLTKSNGTGSEEIKARLKDLNPRAEIIECRHSPRYLQNVYSEEKKDLSFLKDLPVVLLSGIAVPAGFESLIENMGGRILDKHRFVDHHRYTQQELIDIINKAQRQEAKAIITTEKDAVRLPMINRHDVPVYFLRVNIEIISGKEDFHDCISRICFH